MSPVIDFAARQRAQGHEPPPLDEGTVLSVLPIPGVDAAFMIVGYMVPLEGGRQAALPPLGEDLVVDRASRVVLVDGREIELTFREFQLLDHLYSAPGRVYNRRQLLAAVWDRYGEEGARTVDVHVLRLRRKLGRHADRIVTVRNVGYKYQPPRQFGS